ncbi:hypothetical protein [Geodermatophilus chilensis]|jgi:transposase-like protein|nr:hypothetical protein [Geodermatophilus chilensis]
MRVLRATVVAVVGAAAVLLVPGAATADVAVQHDCAQLWFWWIPLPCDPD